MTYLSNIHTHTSLCDGANTAAEMAAAAYRKGFVSLGFSGHSPLPYANNYAMKPEQLADYRAQVLAERERYAGKMEILLGLEWDLDSPAADFPLDFQIGSVHQLHPNGECFAVDDTKEEFEACAAHYPDMRGMISDFYRETVRSALRPGVTAVGHFDLISKFNEEKSYFDPEDSFYRDTALAAMEEILSKRPELLFEINTGAMARGYRTSPYPDSFLLRCLADRNARVILNSDAHIADAIDAGFAEAAKMAYGAGLKTLFRLRSGGAERVSL